MPKLVIHQEKVEDPQVLVDICPFGAMEEKDGKLSINAACKMCKLCVKKGPAGAVEYVEDEKKEEIDKSQWNGIAVYVDHVDGEIHPVTYELIGKARELASKINHPVYALFMGNNISDKAEELLHYGVDKVFVYDFPELARFKIESYTSVFEDFIKKHQPCAILTGATTVGRQLAPRVAARMKTGLTADCTILEMDENTDLSQIRPAFGGNIMAHILTPNNRPQMATVRYKVMNAPERTEETHGEIISCAIDKEKIKAHVDVLDIVKKEPEKFIESADVKNKIVEEHHPMCVEMEGAAIGHTCCVNDIPFVIIRTMSDNADEEAAESATNFEETAARHSAGIVMQMLSSAR